MKSAIKAAVLFLAIAGAACAPAEEVPAFWFDASERAPELAIQSQLDPATPESNADTLRVVTYNVKFGSDIEGLVALFGAAPFDRADVFLLQEIEDHQSEGRSRAEEIASQLGMAFVYLPAHAIDGGTHGMAILSRRPLRNVRFMDLPRFETSIRKRGRVALAVSIEPDVDIVNIHLFLQLSLAERIIQLAPATRGLRPRVVIGGDFNTNPYGWTDMLPNGALDPITDIDGADVVDDAMVEFDYVPATADSGPTHHSPIEELRLDSIYSRGIESGPSTVERQISLSDHWPLWLDLSL